MVLGYYGLHQTFIYGQDITPHVTQQGEIEATPAFDAIFQENYTAGLSAFTEIIDENPNYAPAHFGLAIALLHLDGPNAAVEEFQQAIDIFPWYAEAYIGLATVKVHQRDFEGAIEDLHECLRRRPDYTFAHLLQGYIYRRQNRLEEAAVQYERYLAGVKALRRQISQAVEEMLIRGMPRDELAIFGSPDDIRDGYLLEESLYNLCYLHLNFRGFYETDGQGFNWLRIVDIGTFYNLSLVYMQLEQIHKAEMMLNTAMEHASVLSEHPNIASYKASILNGLGLIRFQKNDLAGFESLLQQALALDPTAPFVHNNLGVLYSQKGQMDKAREHLSFVTANPSAYPLASQNLQAIEAMLAGGAPQSRYYDNIPSIGNPLPKMLKWQKQ